MKIIKIETCFDCPYYCNCAKPDEGQYGICGHINTLDNYPSGIFPQILFDTKTQAAYHNIMHYPEDIPNWCPLEEVV